MSKFRNPRIAALATAATLGVGALAVPSAALAASHASKTKVVKTTKSSSKSACVTTRNILHPSTRWRALWG